MKFKFIATAIIAFAILIAQSATWRIMASSSHISIRTNPSLQVSGVVTEDSNSSIHTAYIYLDVTNGLRQQCTSWNCEMQCRDRSLKRDPGGQLQTCFAPGTKHSKMRTRIEARRDATRLCVSVGRHLKTGTRVAEIQRANRWTS